MFQKIDIAENEKMNKMLQNFLFSKFLSEHISSAHPSINKMRILESMYITLVQY